jgi:homoprotocatechuate degradation regulator HpaR
VKATKAARRATDPGLAKEPSSAAPPRHDGAPLSFGERAAPQNALSVRLLMVRESVMAHIRPVLRAHGMTEQQYRVLRALQFTAPIDSTTLAERAVLLAPSLSRILKDLKELGVVEILPGVNNSRFVRIRLSAKGRAAIEKAALDIDATGRRIAELIGTKKLEQLMGLLDELESRIGTA